MAFCLVVPPFLLVARSAGEILFHGFEPELLNADIQKFVLLVSGGADSLSGVVRQTVCCCRAD